MSPETRAPQSLDRAALHRWLGLGVGVLVVYLVWGGPRVSRRRPSAPTPSASLRAVPVSVATSATTSALTAAELAKPPDPAAAGPCLADMVLVEGDYCTAVEHDCKQWLDDDQLPYARCARYEPPARCTGKRQKLRFCIDRHEHTPAGAALPQNYANFIEAGKVCAGLGKRVCNESEWNFACEGPDMLPYPYGWSRAPVCNQDRSDLFEVNPKKQVLKDWRQPSGGAAGCRSPFGVYDMAGNLDEPVLREAQRYAYPFRNGLKGGWWMAGRNRCRPSTTAHNDHYRDIQIGIRCCQDLGPG